MIIKEAYEQPVVAFTEFDTEDIMTGSDPYVEDDWD